MDDVVEVDAAERLSEFLLGIGENRKHDFGDELRVRLLYGFVDGAGGAQNIVCRHATAFARKLITAMGPRMPLRMPPRTNDWSTNSRWRGGKP